MIIRLFSKIIFFSLLLLLAGQVIAQEEDDKTGLSFLGYSPFSINADTSLAHDIDSILYNCPDGLGRTTIGDITCYQETIVLVEKKIDLEYKVLYNRLDDIDKKLLKKTQDSWNAYFNAESFFLHSAFYTWANYQKYGHGREHAIAQAEWLFKLARQRLIAIRVFSNEIY
ncbi:MAG: lysozyme inhibitor LprI family protein [Bacteroidota bacterium]